MCNCLTEIRVVDRWKNKKGQVPEYVIIDQGIAMEKTDKGFEKIYSVTTSRIQLQMPGKNKPVITSAIHSFCPFCGTEYGQEGESNAV